MCATVTLDLEDALLSDRLARNGRNDEWRPGELGRIRDYA